MSDPVPCPNCRALLSFPPGAPAVRCPNCKTVITVPAAPPVAAAVRKPPPLPFGRPARAKPAAPPPAPARPAAPPGPANRAAAPPAPARPPAAPVRAKLAADNPYDAPAAGVDEATAEADRDRQIREELAELEAKERRDERRYDELVGLCHNARVGMQLFAVGAVGSSGAAVAAVLYVVSALTAVPVLPLAALAYLLMILHWLLTVAGYGYCCRGPREMRGAAVAGVTVTAGHVMFNLMAVAVVAPTVTVRGLTYQGEGFGAFVVSNLLVADSVCNLLTLTDLPLFFTNTAPVPVPVVVLLVLGAAGEFAKLSVLGVITNRYAVAAKDPDLGYQGMRFVYRIFALVLVGPVLKGLVYGLLVVGWVSVPLLLATIGYFLWWAFSWFFQYRVMMDVADILTADRYVDRRARLDYA